MSNYRNTFIYKYVINPLPSVNFQDATDAGEQSSYFITKLLSTHFYVVNYFIVHITYIS